MALIECGGETADAGDVAAYRANGPAWTTYAIEARRSVAAATALGLLD